MEYLKLTEVCFQLLGEKILILIHTVGMNVPIVQEFLTLDSIFKKNE